MTDLLDRLVARLANEPALLGALAIVVASAMGMDPEELALTAATVATAIRQSVYSKRSHEDEVVNTAAHAARASH